MISEKDLEGFVKGEVIELWIMDHDGPNDPIKPYYFVKIDEDNNRIYVADRKIHTEKGDKPFLFYPIPFSQILKVVNAPSYIGYSE